MAATHSGLEVWIIPSRIWPLLLSLLAFTCVVAATAITTDTTSLIISYFHPLYSWDSWAIVDHYKDFVERKYSAAEFFEQHNEHRIAFPRLVFLADIVFTKGCNIINIILIFLIQLFHAILLVIISTKSNKSIISIFSASTVFILLFTFGQSENFIWGFQVQFVGVYAAATVSFWSFSYAAEDRFRGVIQVHLFILSLFTAFVATYTMANGILTYAILFILGIILRVDFKIILTIITISIAVIFSYYYNFQFDGDHQSLLIVLSEHPTQLLILAAEYIGGPMRSFGPVASGALGAAGSVLMLIAGVRMVMHRERDVARSTLVGVMMFVALTAGVTALGRFAFGADPVLSGRYLTPADIFWSAQVLYWGSFAELKPSNWLGLALYATLSSCVVVGAVHEHFESRSNAKENFQNLNLASDALLSGVDAPNVLELVDSSAELVKQHAEFLDEQHLSIFSWAEAGLRGRRLRDAFDRIDDQACLGAFDRAEVLPRTVGVAAFGWAWDRIRQKPVNRIILVDSEGIIVGFASGGWSRPDVREAIRQVQSEDVGWRGFAKLSNNGPIGAYAYLDNGRTACELGEHAEPIGIVLFKG